MKPRDAQAKAQAKGTRPIPETASDVVVVLRPGQRLVVRYEPAQEERAPAPQAAHYTAATWPYGSARSMRAAIASGKVPATKVGREYRVPKLDADTAFAAVARRRAPRARRESENDRITAQLAAAGIVVANDEHRVKSA